jgi:hypothetical protein
MAKETYVYSEYNEKVKQGNFTSRVNKNLSRLLDMEMLSTEIKDLVVEIINLMNILNLHKSLSIVSNKVKVICETSNIELLTQELYSLKISLEDIKSPANDFVNTCKDKPLTKEAERKAQLLPFIINLFDNACLSNKENKSQIFTLLSRVEAMTNTEYLYNYVVSSKDDNKTIKFLLSQLPFIGKTTRAKTVAPYVGSRNGTKNEIQTIAIKMLKNNNIDNMQVLFNGLGGEFSSTVPLLKIFNINKIGLNDINPTTQNLHITIQSNPDGLKEKIAEVYEYIVGVYGSINLEKKDFKVVFKDLLSQLNELEKEKIYDELTAALLMILLTWSFSGQYKLKNGLSQISVGSDIKKYTNHRFSQKIDLFHYLYTEYPVIFTICDYKDILKQEDGVSTLFFNDSPFMVESKSKNCTEKNSKSTNVTYGFEKFLHIENIGTLQNIKGQFIYFNYVNPHISKSVKKNGFKMKRINKTIMNSKVQGTKRGKKTEVIVYSDYLKNKFKNRENPINNVIFLNEKVS